MNFVCYNGKLIDATVPILLAENRCFKYGDGVFETMKMSKGKLLLEAYHLERLLTSLDLLKIHFKPAFGEELSKDLKIICEANNCAVSARIRIAAFRGPDNKVEYLIEARSLADENYLWNEKGWEIDIFPDANKSCDAFSNLKSANYLVYVMADLFARDKKIDEAIVLNGKGFIADGSKTNIFIVKDNVIYTPALTEGPINGVMRRHLIKELKKENYPIIETKISIDALLNADEVFFTNALRGIQWAAKFRDQVYGNTITSKIFESALPII